MAFPQVVSVAHSNSTSTTLTMTMPSGLVAGNLLVAIAACTGNESGPTIGGGFTQVGTLGASNGTLWVSVKIATGSDGSATLTTGFANSKAGSVYQVQGWGGVLADIKAAFVGTTLDVPSLSMPLGADDYLWIAVGKSNGDLTGAPTNYTNYVESTVTGLQLGTARRTLNASSENPGAFAGTSTNPMSALIGITPPEVFGDIVYEGNGAAAYSATNPAAPYPTGAAAGDLFVMIVMQKPATAGGGGVTTPSGFTLLGSLTDAGGYGSTVGADVGNMNLYVYYKVAAGGESGNVTVTTTDNSVAMARIHRLSSTARDDWELAMATGQDTSGGSVSVTFGSDPGVIAEDYILTPFAIPTDVTTPNQFSAQAVTQTGVTFKAMRETGELDTTIGNDLGGFTARTYALSGTSSAAPVMTATAGGTTTNVRGPAMFIRIRRVTSGGASVAQAGVDAAGAAATGKPVKVAVEVGGAATGPAVTAQQVKVAVASAATSVGCLTSGTQVTVRMVTASASAGVSSTGRAGHGVAGRATAGVVSAGGAVAAAPVQATATIGVATSGRVGHGVAGRSAFGASSAATAAKAAAPTGSADASITTTGQPQHGVQGSGVVGVAATGTATQARPAAGAATVGASTRGQAVKAAPHTAATVAGAGATSVDQKAALPVASSYVGASAEGAVTPPQVITLYPDSVASSNGTWVNEVGSSVDLWDSIDEADANDTDYVTLEVPFTGAYIEFSLTDVGDPGVSFGHQVRYRIKSSV